MILMSRSEIDRMNLLRDLAEERIRVSEAATLIGLGRRQVSRSAKAPRRRGQRNHMFRSDRPEQGRLGRRLRY